MISRILVLYGRSYCHLCDDMEAALQPLLQEFGASLDKVDIDQHPDLEERFDELVPVLTAEGKELCRYFLDERIVRNYLGASMRSAQVLSKPELG